MLRQVLLWPPRGTAAVLKTVMGRASRARAASVQAQSRHVMRFCCLRCLFTGMMLYANAHVTCLREDINYLILNVNIRIAGTSYLDSQRKIPRGTAQKGLVLEKNALNRLVHNLLELMSKGYNPTDLSQQPSCNFPGKQIKILFHNLYVD